MKLPLAPLRRGLRALIVAALTVSLFAWPGAALVRDLADPALSGPGISGRAVALHRDITPRIEVWAHERIASRSAAAAPLHDVPTTEWPMFTAVYYLMATAELQAAWERGERPGREPPLAYAGSAVDAARDLLLDPSHHTWVRTHWGDGYLHRENVFFRALIIAGLTAHEEIRRDGSSLPVLILTLSVIYIPGAYRFARALAVNINTMDFITVARVRGENIAYIIGSEILPNIIGPVLADLGLRFVFIVLLLSGLSFLGLGVQPPYADWGALVRENIGGLPFGAPAVIVPSLAIASLTISVNLLIDNLPHKIRDRSV
jgi:hypothetical protein